MIQWLLKRLFLSASLFVLLVALLLWGWHTVYLPETFPIQSIKIEGSFNYVTRHAIEQAVLPAVITHGFFNVDVVALKDRLLTLPWLAGVSVSRVWPDKLVVRVSEQRAVARWGDDSLLNAKAEIFKPLAETLPEGLPLLLGPPGQQDELLAMHQKMGEILSPLGLAILQLDLSARHAWCLILNNGMMILLGRGQPVERLQRFVSVYNRIFATQNKQADRVDLRYDNGLAVHWKQA